MQDSLWSVGLVAGAALLALLAYWLLFSAARKVALRTSNIVNQSLVRHSAGPIKAIAPLLAIFAAIPSLPLSPGAVGAIRHALSLLLIASFGWFAARMLNVLEDLLAARYRIDAADNLEARRIRTQFHVLRRTCVVLIMIVAVAAMLMTVPTIWNLGAGLFASAGVAGLIAGMAARPTLSNLLAGMQIALTQPVRLGDVVIVEGEWGTIEEIASTYVVVRIWDLRRLMVPLSYFIDQPFQNWTRASSNLLGTVFVYVDYSVPVEEVRQEFRRILEASGMWDGNVWGVQVTNATDRTLELRALMSAPDASTAWNLRCHAREKLVAFLQQRYPESLPKMRAEIREAPEGKPARALQ